MADDPRTPRSLEELFGVERIGEDRFRTRLEGFGGRSFGGETLGCATLAAARTCEGRALHSLHASFLRPVPAETPIELRVERQRDGRRLAHRRVRIEFRDRLCSDFSLSFAAPGGGPEYQDARLGADPPTPETLASDEEVARNEAWTDWRPGPMEWRWIGTPWRPASDEPSRYAAWIRPRSPLPHERGLHEAAVAFMSDMHSHWSVARKLGEHFEPHGFVSLDHALWLHRDLPWDDWRLLVTESDVAHAGRALTRRTLYTREGVLVASIAQEALIPGARGRSPQDPARRDTMTHRGDEEP